MHSVQQDFMKRYKIPAILTAEEHNKALSKAKEKLLGKNNRKHRLAVARREERNRRISNPSAGTRTGQSQARRQEAELYVDRIQQEHGLAGLTGFLTRKAAVRIVTSVMSPAHAKKLSSVSPRGIVPCSCCSGTLNDLARQAV